MLGRSALAFLLLPLGLLAVNFASRGDDKAKAAADEGPQPKLITLQATEISLADALKALTKQTGHEVEDRRQNQDEVKFKLDLKKATFWQALDAIAKAADLRVNIFEKDGKISLVEGPFKMMPVSYNGLFRATVTRMQLIHSLDTDQHMCRITMELAWEPSFQPILLDAKNNELVIEDDKGRTVEPADMGQGMSPVSRKNATEIVFVTSAPQRSAAKLALLKGKVGVVGPSRMIEFTYDKLAPILKKNDARKQTEEGVAVTLRELKTEGQEGDQVWTATLFLEYPEEGPKFESFQSWIVNNEIVLEKEKDGIKQRFPPNLGYETDDSVGNKAIIRYRFGDEPERKLVLGKFSDWKLIYKTPGKIAEIPVTFEFKDLMLP